MIAYFRYEDGFIAITGRSPKGMKGLVYIGRGPEPGKGIESVCEQGYAKSRLERFERIASSAVPDEWINALGYEHREAKPKIEPQPVPEPEIVRPIPKPRPRPIPSRPTAEDVLGRMQGAVALRRSLWVLLVILWLTFYVCFSLQ